LQHINLLWVLLSHSQFAILIATGRGNSKNAELNSSGNVDKEIVSAMGTRPNCHLKEVSYGGTSSPELESSETKLLVSACSAREQPNLI
jgi:hypothetical protein